MTESASRQELRRNMIWAVGCIVFLVAMMAALAIMGRYTAIWIAVPPLLLSLWMLRRYRREKRRIGTGSEEPNAK
ncbi:hypothetical protein [Saccharibacillus alkalitolerans]|uniref:Uncharacterized protein n=1 Tax=Saccharibacillus alkalitolerans TaxID=2705290 RepID=A0ABX0F236_9BACL|nr:hypothetical protein [Saccharibacillus alkalitolerans]NGZ74971.1 hypothetical protein [Saccharibacillus alkalitolerans]